MVNEKKVISARSVRLQRFHVKAYRSCKDTQFAPLPTLTALIGRNGSGKTNILQSLLLLRDTPVYPRRTLGDKQDFSFQTAEIGAQFQVGANLAQYRAAIRYRTNDENRDEIASSNEQWRITRKNRKATRWFNFSRRYFRYPPTQGDLFDLDADHGLYNWRSQVGRVGNITIDDIRVIRAVALFVQSINYYSASQFTRPALCPTSFETDARGNLRAESQSKSHTYFIYELYRAHKNSPEQYALYLSLVGKTGIGLIENIRWKELKIAAPGYQVRTGGQVIRSKGVRIVVVPSVDVAGTSLSFNQLSEGTFRTLAMLFYLMQDRSELILVEEPEVCVHHGLLDAVIAVMKDCAKRKQIIFSTHSELVVDRLAPENVILVERERGGGTVARPISDALSERDFSALKKYLATTGNLGEFWRHSGFEK